jgi:eukaryotic-like serine/threonine-protein kinase
MSTYTKIEEIGRGNFGVVELVQDEQGNHWACKTFTPPDLPDVKPEDLRARFEREVRYQVQIKHPNVVRIHDYNLDDDPPWFVMELADCSLADELKADRTLGGDPRQPLFDTLAGLETIHEKGYKHRDLKPANILRFVSPDGSVRYAISDFGLMSPASGQTSTLTSSNMGGGTPLYRAPECAINFKRATVQSDIYSVGAILHDIFGGGASRIPHIELNVAGPIGPIVQRCTKTNVRRRYPTVAALREQLYEVLSEKISFSSREEEEVVNLLHSKDQLTEQEWDRVFQQIDETEEKGGSHHALFRALTIVQLEGLAEEAPDLFASLGRDYAKYAYAGTFDFDYCDVVATRADVFYERGELDLKASIALAMLELGTSHNRWFVERKFMSMVGADISEALAERTGTEIDVQGINFARLIQHVEQSISASRNDLHPILLKKVGGAAP